MPESSSHSPNNPKKARLGRGLGSLLGGGLDQAPPPTPENTAAAAPAQPAAKPQVSVNSPAKPVTAAATPASAVVAAPEKPAPPPIPEESQIWKIPIDRLSPNKRQPRQIFESEALKELAASIKEHGILQPITARRLGEREFEIIAGERRFRAAQLAGLHEVPVILKKVDDEVSFELAIIENIQRADLNPMEEAEAYELLMHEYSLTQQQVSEKLGKDRSSVANILRLLTLPPEIKIMVRHNELSAGHAKVLLSAPDAKTQIQLAKQVIEEKLSVRATEKLVAKAKTDERAESAAKSTNSPANVSSRVVESLSSELQKLIGTKVAIDYADSKGRLSIHFYSDDQLTHVVERLRKAWEK